VLNDQGQNVLVISGVGHLHQCRDPAPLWSVALNSELSPFSLPGFEEGMGVRGLLETRSPASKDSDIIAQPYRAG
jgi:hypothetical protein